MKIIVAMLLLLACCGCTQSKPQPAVTPTTTTSTSTSAAATGTITSMPMPMDSDAVERVKKEAIARHLHMYIICNEDPTQDAFAGEAWPDQGNNLSNPQFIEEGGIPSWAAWGNTQDSVARQLYKLVQGAPNYYPKHKRSALSQHRQCPEPVRM